MNILGRYIGQRDHVLRHKVRGQLELVEGHAYTVAGLIPLNSDSETIYLHASGSTTTWQTLPSSAIASFEPFFTARKPVFLSNMGEVPLA
ncbi:Breast cancer susceptibility 2-like protein, partial [Thalictrum thalictroides]